MNGPYYDRHGVTVHAGDCLDVLRDIPDASVHAVVCDPPYGLADIRPAQVTTAVTAWANGDREHVPNGRGFMGRDWDAFVPPPAVWDECLRVLTPGGHLVAFAGSRTYDLMGLSIRMAGFEIRDGLQWLYGSGFPKSMDVSKAIDKARDDKPAARLVAAYLAEAAARAGMTAGDLDVAFGFAGRMAGQWMTQADWVLVPRWEQWERLRELLGFGDEMDAEVWRLNGRKGAPGEAWDQREITQEEKRPLVPGEVISFDQRSSTERERRDIPATAAAREWSGWGTALKPAHEPIVLARKPLSGTVAATVIAHGTGALHVDACRTGTGEDRTSGGIRQGPMPHPMSWGEEGRERTERASGGRWPANVLLDEGAAAELDEQSAGTRASKPAKSGSAGKAGEIYNSPAGSAPVDRGDEPGGASRFFPVFRWEAKAPTLERPQVDGVAHPTVKPLAVMRWLVRLLTPPGGLVLDPFAGSGTTLHAARAEGFRAIGIEREPSYLPLIKARLDARPRAASGTQTATDNEPMDLLDLLDEGGAA